MKHLLIHIHGFLSAHDAERVSELRAYIHDHALNVDLISPQLPETPEAAVESIESIIQAEQWRRPSVSLIGHSLGAYYATYLASRHHLRAVLINPVVRAYELMCEFFGACYNPHTDQNFDIAEADIRYLVGINLEQLPDTSLFLVMLQLGDEIVDAHEAERYYQGCELIVEQGGRHDFDSFSDHLAAVTHFLYGKRSP